MKEKPPEKPKESCPECGSVHVHRTHSPVVRGLDENRAWCSCSWSGKAHQLVLVESK